MSPATQALHFQLLRLLKGAVKAYETWLRAETCDSELVQFAPRSTTPPTSEHNNTSTQTA